MSQPLGGGLPFSADHTQFKTVIYQEGHHVAILIDRRQNKRRQRSLRMPSAEAALAYCRRTAAALLYLPESPSRN